MSNRHKKQQNLEVEINGSEPSPKRSYAEMLSAFDTIHIGCDVKFLIQLCNSQGQQRPGEECFNVEASVEHMDEKKPKEDLEVRLLREGKYEVKFSPPNLGSFKFNASLDGDKLKKSPIKFTVKPRGQLGCEIKGPLVGPRDLVFTNSHFLVSDGISKALVLVDCLGRETSRLPYPKNTQKKTFSPMGVAVYRDVIFVADMGNSCVHIYKQSEEISSQYRHYGKFGSKSLVKPIGITVHPITGDIFVSDFDKNSIFIFDNKSYHVKEVIDTNDCDSELEQINFPQLIAINDGGDRLLVCDQGNTNIKIFGLDSKSARNRPIKTIPVKFHTIPAKPVGVVVGKGNIIYVTALHNKGGVVLTYSSDGTFLGSFGDKELSKPGGIALLPASPGSPMIFVADSPGSHKNGALKGFIE